MTHQSCKNGCMYKTKEVISPTRVASYVYIRTYMVKILFLLHILEVTGNALNIEFFWWHDDCLAYYQ